MHFTGVKQNLIACVPFVCLPKVSQLIVFTSVLWTIDQIKLRDLNAVAQWWEHLPPTTKALIWFLDLASHVGWLCCWFSTCTKGFSLGSSVFLPPWKPTRKISNWPGKWWRQVCQLCCWVSLSLNNVIYLFCQKRRVGIGLREEFNRKKFCCVADAREVHPAHFIKLEWV